MTYYDIYGWMELDKVKSNDEVMADYCMATRQNWKLKCKIRSFEHNSIKISLTALKIH
jgi:hypothetical protein